MDINAVQRILSLPDDRINAFLKPKQKMVLRKLISGEELDENEKRYLRGNIRKKIEMISSLIESVDDDPLREFTKGISSYYISGYEALKHNGFGWYFDTKRILIYNTRVEGKYRIPGKSIILKRVRSIRNREFKPDENTGIIYASNSQIMIDAISEGDLALVRECRSHAMRYGKMFIQDNEETNDVDQDEMDLSRFGV